MRKNLQQIIEASKQFIYTSETPQVLGSTTLLRFKIPKLSSIFAGNQSCLVLNWNCSTQNGIISAGGLLNSIQRASLLIGGQRIINIEEAGKYLSHKVRSIHTASELKDLGTYIYGINDDNKLTQTFAGNAQAVGTSDFSLFLSPSLQIYQTANDVANYQLQVPLSLVFDILMSDFPMYMLSNSDLVMEFVINNSVTTSLLTTTNIPTALNLVTANTYIYGVYYQMDFANAVSSVNLPFTDVFFTSQSFSAVGSANMSWTLANNRVKKIYAIAQTANDPILGGYNSSFIDSGSVSLTAQLRYNDNQYFTEPVPMDASAYQYLSECGKHGFQLQVGRYTISDQNFLSNYTFSPTSGQVSRNAGGDQNILGLNFGKVPCDSVLYEMSDDMKNQVMDTNPIILQLRPQVSANTITKNVLVHVELMKVLNMGVGNRSVMVN